MGSAFGGVGEPVMRPRLRSVRGSCTLTAVEAGQA